MKRVMILVLVLTMAAAACGDDDGGDNGTDGTTTTTLSSSGLTGGEQAIADVIAGGMTEDSDSENPFSQEAAAQCFAEGAVADLGIGRLAEIGLAADTEDTTAAFALLSDDEINDLADLALGCIDVATAMAPQFAGDGISDASALCMATELGETDFYKEAFIAGMTGDETYDPGEDPEFLGLITAVALECLTEDELALIMSG